MFDEAGRSNMLAGPERSLDIIGEAAIRFGGTIFLRIKAKIRSALLTSA
jgi:hypothetical protein